MSQNNTYDVTLYSPDTTFFDIVGDSNFTELDLVSEICNAIKICKKRKIREFDCQVYNQSYPDSDSSEETFTLKNARFSELNIIKRTCRLFKNCKEAKTNMDLTIKIDAEQEKVTTHGFYNDCSICFEIFKKSEDVKELACKHIYHPKCIDRWLQSHPNCPICRSAV